MSIRFFIRRWLIFYHLKWLLVLLKQLKDIQDQFKWVEEYSTFDWNKKLLEGEVNRVKADNWTNLSFELLFILLNLEHKKRCMNLLEILVCCPDQFFLITLGSLLQLLLFVSVWNTHKRFDQWILLIRSIQKWLIQIFSPEQNRHVAAL